MYFELLCDEFAKLDEIVGICLGGSRAGDNYDEKSDYDLYLYCTKLPDEETRKRILNLTCQYIEFGNHFWELEDDCTLKNGIDIDILYRNPDDFCTSLANVVEDCNNYNGYTTCMWHNLITCKIIYDPKGIIAKMKERFNVPYPQKLRNNIINNNLKLLHGYLPSYDGQIKKALERKDVVAINHRTSAFMESYFDIIFALNQMTHPGEKRMILYAQRAEILPRDFEENINKLFKDLFTDYDAVLDDLKTIYDNLVEVIK